MTILDREEIKQRLKLDSDKQLFTLLRKLRIQPLRQGYWVWETIEERVLKAVKPKAGRPKLPANRKRVHISATIPQGLKDEIEEYCLRNDMKYSVFIEQSIRRKLRKVKANACTD